MGAAPIIWVLADDRAGNRAQCIGVAERLNHPVIIKEIRYNGLIRLPNFLRRDSLLGLTGKSRRQISAPWPDAVISAGRRVAPVAAHIKRQSPATKLIHLMWPDTKAEQFDCIVLPSHDREHHSAMNVLRVLGAPHRVTAHALKKAAEEWRQTFAELPPPRLGMLIGGTSKHGQFYHADYARLGAIAAAMAEAQGGSVLATTSRRTGKKGEETLAKQLRNVPHYLHFWEPGKGGNPYPALLDLADTIIVTADSISMVSEACSTGKTVFLYEPTELSTKHKRFAATLIGSGYAYPLTEEYVLNKPPKPLKKQPLDSADTVARHIEAMLQI